MSRRRTAAISLYVEGKKVLIVGESPDAHRTTDRWKNAGALVTRVATKEFREEMCDPYFAVLAQDLDAQSNRSVAEAGRGRATLVYARDLPELCDFAMPAQVSQGPLHIAISTEGVAPALAGRFRAELASLVQDAGPALERLFTVLERIRAQHAPGPRRAEKLRTCARHLHINGRIEISETDP